MVLEETRRKLNQIKVILILVKTEKEVLVPAENVEVNVGDVVNDEIPTSLGAGKASEEQNISVMEKKQGGGILC